MRRFHNWPALLDAFIASRGEMAFLWGANDCCVFACDAVLAMTGVDLAEGFRNSYTTAREARAALREHFQTLSIGEMADAIAERYGLRSIPASFAARGDVVLLDRELGESLGIVSLDGTEIWAPGEERLAEVPFREGRRGWRI